MKASPEVMLILSKMKGGKKPSDDAEESAEDSGDVSAEAMTAACEALFKALRGREGSDQEIMAVEEAMDDYCTAKGY
jgi:hypothetical protein